MKSKKKIGKKNQDINDNGLGALQTKQLLTFVYLFLQIQRAFFASFFHHHRFCGVKTARRRRRRCQCPPGPSLGFGHWLLRQHR